METAVYRKLLSNMKYYLFQYLHLVTRRLSDMPVHLSIPFERGLEKYPPPASNPAYILPNPEHLRMSPRPCGQVALVDHEVRFTLALQTARQLLRDGALGEVRSKPWY